MPIALTGLLFALSACNVVQPAQEDPTRYFVAALGEVLGDAGV